MALNERRDYMTIFKMIVGIVVLVVYLLTAFMSVEILLQGTTIILNDAQ